MSSINFSGRDITIRTLSVAETKEILDQLKADSLQIIEKGKEPTVKPPHVVDLLFNDDIPAIAVAKSSGVKLNELAGDVPPQQVRDLIDAVRAQNPFFLGMMERLVGAGKKMVAK